MNILYKIQEIWLIMIFDEWFSACVLVARLDFHSYGILYVIDKDNSPPIKNWGSGTFLRFAGQLDRQRSRYSRHIDSSQIYYLLQHILHVYQGAFQLFLTNAENHEWPDRDIMLYANPPWHIATIASVIFLNPKFVTVKVLTEEWENDWPFQNDLVRIHKAATSNPLAPQELVAPTVSPTVCGLSRKLGAPNYNHWKKVLTIK